MEDDGSKSPTHFTACQAELESKSGIIPLLGLTGYASNNS